MSDKVRLGISACLLGQNVRYDGGNKLDLYLSEELGKFVEWVPVCPEVECGLTIPREVMRLAGVPSSLRLVEIRTGVDHTEKMLTWADRRLDELQREGLRCFIFKARSPSCGWKDADIFDRSGLPVGTGSGLFAQAFVERFARLPVQNEEAFDDTLTRETFIASIFPSRAL